MLRIVLEKLGAEKCKRVIAVLLAIVVIVTQQMQTIVPVAQAFQFFGFFEEAAEKESYELVAVLVDEGTLNDSTKYEGLKGQYDELKADTLKERIERYAEDVQKGLQKTKVKILTVKAGDDPVKITYALEKLYFEGDGASGEQNKLRGVVIVGDVPLPVVNKNGNRFVSVWPYTDFEQKGYVFNPETRQFEKDNTVSFPKPEVWHGVIRPPVSGTEGRVMLAEFFDKNHLYHSGHPDFAEFDQKMFFADLVSEEKNLNREAFPYYENFLKNMEDLAYGRYTKKWAAQLEQQFSASLKDNFSDILTDGGKQLFGMKSDDSFPDIQAKNLILKFHLPYVELFSNYLSKVNDWVSATGRYGVPEDVDTITSLITQKDAYVRQYLKLINDSIEAKVDQLVESIAVKVPLLSSVKVSGNVCTKSQSGMFGGQFIPPEECLIGSRGNPDNNEEDFLLFVNHSFRDYYNPYVQSLFDIDKQQKDVLHINGIPAPLIEDASQCSLVRGTPTSEEALESQAAYLLRSGNLETLNTDVMDQPNLDSRKLPTFGFSAIPLSVEEALLHTNNQYMYGALVKDDPKTGWQAFFNYINPILEIGDVILEVNGKKITPLTTIQDALRGTHPDKKVMSPETGELVKEEVNVRYYRSGEGVKDVKMSVKKDLNQDEYAGGCYAINYSTPQNCFPEIARIPVFDPAGSYPLDTPVSLSPGAKKTNHRACYNFSLKEDFFWPNFKFPDKNKNLKDYLEILVNSYGYGFLLDLRKNPSTDRTKVDQTYPYSPYPKQLYLAKNFSYGFPKSVTFDDILRMYGAWNQRDDDGDSFDTNGNGKQDQIVWNDKNNNGVIDPFSPEDANCFDDKGSFTCPPSDLGEFLGGDWGVDEPDEATKCPYKHGAPETCADPTVTYTWDEVQRDFFEILETKEIHTPLAELMPADNNAKVQAEIDTLKKSSLLETDLQIESLKNQFIEDTPGNRGIALQSAKIYVRFEPQPFLIAQGNVKELSTVFYHKEPTPETLLAQMKSGLSKILPIDNPRYVTFLPPGNDFKTDSAAKIIYPNAFASANATELLAQIDEKDKELGEIAAAGGLTIEPLKSLFVENEESMSDDKKMFLKIDSAKIADAYAWKNMSLDDKHAYVLEHYLNTAKKPYVGGPEKGYEALYLIATGESTYVDMSFNGNATLEEKDQNYQAAFGNAESGPPGSEIPAEIPAETEATTAASGLVSVDELESVPLLEWFSALKKWLEEIQKSPFEPVYTSLAEENPKNAYEMVQTSAAMTPMKSLSVSVDKKTLRADAADVATVTVEAKDANGNLTNGEPPRLIQLLMVTSGGAESPFDIESLNPVPLSNGRATFKLVTNGLKGNATIAAQAIGTQGSISEAQVGEYQTTETPLPPISSNQILMRATLERLHSAVPDSIVADGKTSIPVKVELLDENNNVVMDDNSTVVQFSLGEGQDILATLGAKQMMLKKGVAETTLTSKTISGVVDVNAQALEKALPIESATVFVTAGTPETLVIQPDTKVLKVGGITKARVKMYLKDKNNNIAAQEPMTFTVATEGPGVLDQAFDSDLEKEGIQLTTFNGIAEFDVISTNEPGTITVKATMEALEGETAVASAAQIVSREDLELDILTSSNEISANGTAQVLLTARMVDWNGDIVNFSGPIVFVLSDTRFGKFASSPPEKMTNGFANISFRSSERAGDTFVSVSSPGYALASTTIKTVAGHAKVIRLMASQNTISSGGAETVELEAKLYDQFGNFSENDSATQVNFRLTDDTKALGILETANPVTAQNGVVKAVLRSTLLSGAIRVVAEGLGLSSGAVEILSRRQFTAQDFFKTAPSVLYATLLGSSFGDVSQENYLAGRFLFSGKTQAVASLIAPPQAGKKLVSVDAFGNVATLDDSAVLQVLPSPEPGVPVRIAARDTAHDQDLAEFFVKTAQKNIAFYPENTVVSDLTDGVFVRKVSGDADNEFKETNDGIVILRDGQEKVLIMPSGEIIVKDNNFSLRLTAETQIPTFEVLYFGEKVAEVIIKQKFDEDVKLISALSFANLPPGVYAVPRATMPDIQFEPLYSGFSTQEKRGIAVTNVDESLPSNQAPGNIAASLEDALTEPGVGFSRGNKHMLLLANGNSVGEAHLPYASEIGVVLGDPTVKLKPAKASDTGFTKDIGKQIFAGEDVIKDVIRLDYNGDKKQDLLLAYADGFMRLLEYVGGEQKFSDRGNLLSIANGINSAAAGDFNKDGFDDIVVATTEPCRVGEVCVDLYENKNGFFERKNLPLKVAQKIFMLKVDDLNKDGYPDIVTSDQLGTVKAFYNQKGTFNIDGQLLGDFGLTVDENKNLISNVQFNVEESEFLKNLKANSTKSYTRAKSGPVELNEKIEVAITLKNTLQSVSNLRIEDLVPDFLEVDPASIKCENCGNVEVLPTEKSLHPFAISGIELPLGQTRTIKYTATILRLPKISISIGNNFSEVPVKDQYPDIAAVPDNNPLGIVLYIYSKSGPETQGGPVPYVLATYTPAQKPAGEDMLSKFGSLSSVISPLSDTPVTTPPSGFSLKDFINIKLSSSCDPENMTLDTVNECTESVVANLRCSGGCLALPINYSFLTYGEINLYGVPGGIKPDVLPVFGWGATCHLVPVWPPCPFQTTKGGRFYVSPTLTGRVGFAVCLGPYPSGTCYAFAPPVNYIPQEFCDSVNGALSDAIGNSSGDVSTSGSGYTGVVANGSNLGAGQALPPTTETAGGFDLNTGGTPVPLHVSVSTNIRVPGFPAVLTNWLDNQLEEILNKLADLPDIYLIYPKLSSLYGAFLPQKKFHGFSELLNYINSIPLVQIEAKDVVLKVPMITRQGIEKVKRDLELWLIQAKDELDRFIEVWECDLKSPYPTVCEKVRLHAESLISAVEKNLAAIEKWKNFPKKVLQYKTAEAKYARQLINYMDTISQYFGGYIGKQQKRVEQWLELVNKIKNIVASWQFLVNVSADYVASCDSCKSDRYSLLEFLMKVFVVVPDPPIFPFPKWPDIVIDISQIQAGLKIVWPDVVFRPEPLIIPPMPRFTLPDVLLPGIEITLPPLIPVIPDPPALPELPDLPPLPLFKLPDLPPAPKIPALDAIAGGKIDIALKNISKVMKFACLVKRGLVPVPEQKLSTEIETLTARPLNPLLPIDLSESFQSSPISYDIVDRIEVTGKLNFQMNTDVVYDLVKSFAELSNSFSTNLIKTQNEKLKNYQKKIEMGLSPSSVIQVPDIEIKPGEQSSLLKAISSTLTSQIQNVPKQVRLVATETLVPFEQFTQNVVQTNSSNNYAGVLRDRLSLYLHDQDRLISDALHDGDRFSLEDIVASQKNISRYLAAVDMAFAAPADAPESAAELDSITTMLKETVKSQASNFGVYIMNQKTGVNEKLIAYTDELDQVTHTLFVDAENDFDEDFVYSIGGNVYFKENYLQGTAEKMYPGSPEITDMETYVPDAPSITGVSGTFVSYKTADLSWKPSSLADLEKYEISYIGKDGEKTVDVPVTTLENPAVPSVSLKLENGNYYAHVQAVSKDGKRSTISETTLLAPQVCGDTQPPFPNVGALTRDIPILRIVTIDASQSFDSFGEIVSYYMDTDITKDDNGDGEPDNDKNINNSGNPIFNLGPYDAPGTRKVKVYVVDQSNNAAGQEVTINVYVPKPNITQILVDKGVVSGNVEPHEKEMPITLIRKRSDIPEILAEVKTDSKGEYRLENLDIKPKNVIKDKDGKVIAEVDQEKGKFVILDENYEAEVFAAEPPLLPTRIILKNKEGDVVTSLVPVPDVNNDTTIDPPETVYDKNSVLFYSGVHVKDNDITDDFLFRKIPANDPDFYGSTEVIYVPENLRTMVVSTDGNIYLLDKRMSVRLKEMKDTEDPYVIELLFEEKVIGEVYIAFATEHYEVLSAKNFKVPELKAPEKKVFEKPKVLPFNDVPEDYFAFEAIQKLKEKGIVEGFQEGLQVLFKPEQLITRAEFTKIILKILCIEPSDAAHKAPGLFNDVPYAEPLPWYYPFVKESKIRNFITGYMGEKDPKTGFAPFKPNNNITVAEATKIILEALTKQGVLTLQNVQPIEGAPWYMPYLQVAKNLEPYLAEGKTLKENFILTAEEAAQPNKTLTRAEFAVIASRVLDAYDCYAFDADNDGLPDEWEKLHNLNPFSKDDANGDPDKDGLITLDEFKYSTDPFDPDTDDGGVKDGIEVKEGTNPLDPKDDVADSDSDGLTDEDELNVYKTDPNDSDTDDGGVNDGAEVARGTDPLDKNDDVVNPKSYLPEGLYLVPAECNVCPCPASIANTAQMLPGDTVYAVIANPDHSIIYAKSNEEHL